jgi:iron complex outermembrane receptor protein
LALEDEKGQAVEVAAAGAFQDFDELALEDMLRAEVSTVSKHVKTEAEAPASVSVLTHEDFERNGCRNVADVLSRVPGMYISWGRDYFYPGVRGVSLPMDRGTRILVLLDGHTMNNPWSSAGHLAELMTLPIEAIDRIEVIRGPASSMYGSNAFLAVVNIMSRRPVESRPSRWALDAGWSSTGRYRGTVSGHQRLPLDIDLSVYAVMTEGDGPRIEFADMTRPRLSAPLPTATGGVTDDTDFERGYNLGATLAWNGLSLQLHFSDRLKGLPSAPRDSIFDDPYNATADLHGFAELTYQLEISDHALLARAYADRFRSREFLHRDPTDWETDRWFSDDPHTVSEGNVDTYGGEIRGLFQLHQTDTLTVGAEIQTHEVSQPTYELDLQDGKVIEDSLRGGILRPDGTIEPVSYWNLGLYAQNDWRLLQPLSLVVGLRFDYNSVFTGSAEEGLSPRAAVVYSPVEDANIKLMYGEAFRNPSVFEAYFDDGTSVCGNPDLKAERARTVELAGMWEMSKGVVASASVFYTRMQDLLGKEQVDPCYEGSGPRLRLVNQGEMTVVGGEAQIQALLPLDIRLFANLGAWYVSQDTGGDSGRPPNSPPVIANLGGSFPLWEDRLILSARLRYLSERLNWTLDEDHPEKAYLRVDASLVARRILTGARASINVTNVLNAGFRHPVTSSETIPAAIPQDGIAVTLKVGHEW